VTRIAVLRVITLVVLASWIPVHPKRLPAQSSSTGIAAVDSASVARSSWAAAAKAIRANDISSARQELIHAANAWPTQPAYLWGRAVVAARTRDTAGLKSALTNYAALGLGKDLRADTTFAAFANSSWFASLVTEHERNRSVIKRSTVRATLSDSTTWPEGMDFDWRSNRFYVSSVRHRTIIERAPNGSERDLIPRDVRGNGSVLGVRVDAARGVVWATMAGLSQMEGFTPPDSTIASLVRIRISDGAIERRWEFPTNKHHLLGDLAIAPNGDVFVTDSDEPVLYRLRPGADTLEAIRNPLFRSLQGPAPSPDGRFLYLSDYAHGLLRVDLQNGTVIRLSEPAHVTTLGCDGIVLYHNSIIAIQNGVSPARVMRFTLDRSGERIVRAEILDRNWKIADEPTIGTIIGNDFVYVANSQWEKYSDNGVRKVAVPLSAPVILSVRLRP
jgi:sugar lactone lactonase YvrE